jgi:putative isomerase
MKFRHLPFYSVLIVFALGCQQPTAEEPPIKFYAENMLDYNGTPQHKLDKNMLMFSDQGAWFAYSFPNSAENHAGFSGPFLMTQQNGVWSSGTLAALHLFDEHSQAVVWDDHQTISSASHLKQTFSNAQLSLKQTLVFNSGHTAHIRSQITNMTDHDVDISFHWKSEPLMADGLKMTSSGHRITITSDHSEAVGHLTFPESVTIQSNDSSYQSNTRRIHLAPNVMEEVVLSQTFTFPEDTWEEETLQQIDFKALLSAARFEKETQLMALINNVRTPFQEDIYYGLLAKAQLTLQNNWRVAAGELKHAGLFPSYHYKWFNGFWSWDSWKHAVGLSYYMPELAKDQLRAMFDFQSENGFIVDCVFRDTTIEKHNYRDTKPPLAAWSVAKIYAQDQDLDFVKEFYPKLQKYHSWWYSDRDHDGDGLCEYGSTDGSLVAAKWESGMDNAIRFDSAKILQNGAAAYSINQESVDLNAYLYAEKLFLAQLAEALQLPADANEYAQQAEILKLKIQEQFYDQNDGWFYDTNLAGDVFIKGEGSEGWTALWARAATQEQAASVRDKMMDPQKFFTKIPFQTMSADHAKFDPLKGYWRGPNWLDQAYFGVKGLRNYGFDQEADRATIAILKGADGLLDKGTSIRENYHPITGEGLNAHNFSWSAAHVIMMLMED